MKISNIISIIKVWVITSVIIILLSPTTVFAWGDNSEDGKGRPSYTIEEIKNGAIGATFESDGENYKSSPNYPGQIIFNTISDSVMGNEKNFIGARECILLEDGSWKGSTKDTIWNGNDITVEDGKYYIIRLYVHNNNPNGEDAVAEDVHVAFSLPHESAKDLQVNGFIRSSNASPSEYWDYVNLHSDTAFHLEFISNSGLLENNGIGVGGLILSDDVVKAKSGGILIGYDALDGRIPGCYQYDSFVTIVVRAVYDTDYSVDKKVRIRGDADKTWKEQVDAKIGDEVEFRIEYRNTSNQKQEHVVIRDSLPSNLEYIPGSTEIVNSSHSNGAKVNSDALVADTGITIGDYNGQSNAIIYFRAKTIDKNLNEGINTCVNWARASVDSTISQNYATVVLYKDTAKYKNTVMILRIVTGLCFIGIVILSFMLLLHRRQLKRHQK